MEESILLRNASTPIAATTEAVAEPGPNWQVAKKIWGVAWGIHWIGFGVLFAESVPSIRPELRVLLIVCQSFFILWGLLLSGSFIYSGWKVINYVEQVQQQLGSMEKNGTQRNSPKQKSRTTKVARVTLVTSVLGAVVCFMQFYSMISLYAFYSYVTDPEPWSWLAFQSCFRLVELAMACTIAYSVMQPRERKNVSRRHPMKAQNEETTL
ncbi:uncharacterized protein LOC141876495 isoform X2 [Acropora palmata]|uniref:uncharacterized protein LOC141876495 isoform X2 n=1 Tax=Acropora palmata TaxID=6131 RepID=UPI003D9FB95A